MNNHISTPSSYQLHPISTYTILQSLNRGSFGPAYESSSSWKKFVDLSTQRPQAKFITIDVIVPTERTTIAGPVILKPTPLPKDYDARVESFLHFLDTLDAEVETIDDAKVE